MTKSEITIVVVSYYRAARLKRCLDTLLDMPNVIVWDNNTTGDELKAIKQLEASGDYPNTRFIYHPENVGIPKAWNQGIIHSDTDWVLQTCDDMLFDEDWFTVLNNILLEKPHLEQIHLNAWNAVAFHKQTIVRMGWWDERYRYYPSMEDDDWYLRTVECLGYSPYGTWAQHIPFPSQYLDTIEPYIAAKADLFNQADNFTYYCNSEHSKHKVIGYSTITGQEEDAGSRNTAEGSLDTGNNMTGVEFHFTKWQPIYDASLIAQESVLLAKDGRLWKRVLDDVDFYPQQRAEYAKKYFNIDLTYTDEN
jgi:glycosyltransferase involved in cell wall biosynthesis